MSFYADHIVPYLVHLSMQQEALVVYRKRVIGAAEGQVLEIGVGSGMNFAYYSSRAEHVIGLDPSAKLLSMAAGAKKAPGVPIDLFKASAEEIPLDDKTIDTVVTTWTLCTIPDVKRALSEMQRVLKPTGHLLFVEHGQSPDANVRHWQDRLTPLWRCLAGGCHLNREIAQLIQAAGFQIEQIDTGYMKGPRPMTFMYQGSARPQMAI